jgi:hypothetical protein
LLKNKDKKAEVSFFRIRGGDLDDERREVTENMDLLTLLRGGNNSFMSVQIYLAVVSLYIVFSYSMCYPSAFDNFLEK